MGSTMEEGTMIHKVYGSAGSTRSGTLLHAYDDATTSMTPGDYSTTEATTILNVTECKFISGDIVSCLDLFDYSYGQVVLLTFIRLLKSETYEFVRFKAPGGIDAATIEARKSDKWIVTASIRCRERSDLPASEADLLRLASYLDDIVKLSIVDRRHFQCNAIVSRAAHFCLRATCKQCMTRLAATALRTMATKPARQDSSTTSRDANNVEEMDISRLAKPLEQEIGHQTRLIKEEQLTLERVLEDYSRLIRENDISTGDVKMIIPREGYKYTLQFDPSEVAESVNASPMAEEALDEEAEAEVEEMDEEDYGEEKMPFNVSIEIARDGMDKTLELNAEVTPSVEGDLYDLYIMDLAVNKKDDTGAYAGPSYDSLDDEVREQFDQLITKNFRKFIPLVADYSRAKEAHLYNEWLQDVKAIVAA
ncbi:hypothetical protein PSACC_01900 [Paramicrosporidium saccamoebae]|uniref:Uncharacterized protein n=1 Tax=Paramicrosporidium saccamoebae TaxID=1246581 RepID=A0A2H9TKM0_9FUNG|nr:hypothetical protein PSACC_01900 [Paramicrosporidium saccamoebae]